MSENKEIAIINEYPTDKYNLLVPVKTMQELSDMYKITVNQVQIDPDYNKGADVYVQTKGYNDVPDKLALTKLALSKLMTAMGIVMVESKSIIPSTHKTAIEMAKAIGKVVPYDTRDTAHQVTIKVPEPSGQYRTITMSNEIIIEDLKAEYAEQKKNLKVWKNKKQVPATEEEKEEAVEKQLTQFLSHRRAQCETKALNRCLREAMGIKSTYTKEELEKPFVVAQVVPNLDNPDFKEVLMKNCSQSMTSLFGASTSNTAEQIEASQENSREAEIITPEEPEELPPPADPEEEPEDDPEKEEYYCQDCGQLIEHGSKEWPVKRIIESSQKRFKKNLCIDCFNEELEKAKAGGKK